MTKLFILVLDMKRSGVPVTGLTPMVAALFETLLEVYEPRKLDCYADTVGAFSLSAESQDAWGQQRLWLGETVVPEGALTRCAPGSARDLIDDLGAKLGGQAPSSIVVESEGALRHRVNEGPADWYGRWHVEGPPALSDYANVRFEWTPNSRTVEFSLPMSGYPLTSCRLTTERYLDDGDPKLAAMNRRDICTVLKRLPDALQLKGGEFEWYRDGDFGPLYPGDAADIDETWLPYLNS